MNEPFSFKERIDESLSINFFVRSPSKVIEFIIGFSLTEINNILVNNNSYLSKFSAKAVWVR